MRRDLSKTDRPRGKGRIREEAFLAGILLSLTASFALLGDTGTVTIASGVDKAKIRIGDLIHYTVTITHAPDVAIESPGEGANLGGFEIRGYTVHPPQKEKGRIVRRWEYVISTFFPGQFEIPSLTFAYRLPGDTVRHFLSTEPLVITVESMNPSEEGDIRDIKPPLEIPRNWWLTVRWLLLGLGVIGLGVGTWLLLRRLRAGKGLIPSRETPPPPPDEVALASLGALDPDLPDDPEAIKAYYTTVSEIMRRYLEGRYYVMALELATPEVLDRLAMCPIDPDVREAIRRLLETCDLVKFAKWVPPAESHRAVRALATEIVEKTRIVLGGETPETAPIEAAPVSPEVQSEGRV